MNGLLCLLGVLALIGLLAGLIVWDQRRFQQWGDDQFGRDSGWGDGP